ncbi:hypothetical protein [Fodinibius saliphilus]|uniref:hypothetical protein n=1 Tax=Fodinibius saliphilus TaxID=1920650 RepID=UPI0011098F98|nr:hypothetical protein [Fodinibius saliphilus]
MLQDLAKHSRESIYGGTNQDAFAQADDIETKAENTFNFEASGEGTRKANEKSSELVASPRVSPNSKETEGQEMNVANF